MKWTIVQTIAIMIIIITIKNNIPPPMSFPWESPSIVPRASLKKVEKTWLIVLCSIHYANIFIHALKGFEQIV